MPTSDDSVNEMIIVGSEVEDDNLATDTEWGSFAPGAESQTQTRLVIATYNIRYAVGSFLITGSLLRRVGLKWHGRRQRLVRRHIERAARALSDGKRLPAVDILALQEADKETLRAGGVHVARELAGALKMYYAHAPLHHPRGEEPKSKQWYLDFEEHIAQDDSGETGLAMLSRLPFDGISRIDLPWTECAWRPRLALETIFRVGGENLYFYNAHIDPHASTEEQLAQHRSIIERAERASGPVVLMGDYNTLTKASGLKMRELLEANGYVTPFPNGTATWRAGLIRLHTDWIFVRGARITRSGVARGLGVSDHWPVWAELDLSREGQQ